MLGLSRKLSFKVDRSPEELNAAITQYLSGKRGADAMSYAEFDGSVTPLGFRFEEDHSFAPRGWIRVLTMDGRIKTAAEGAEVSVRLATTKGWFRTIIPALIATVVCAAVLWFGALTNNAPADLKLIFVGLGPSIFALIVVLDYFDRLFILWRRTKKIGHDLPFFLRNYGRHSQLDANP